MLLLLFLLELPSLLFLPRKELFLVLLVSLVQLWAACVGNARACTRRTVVRMDWSDGTRSRIAGPWPSSRASTRRHIRSRRSLGCYDAVLGNLDQAKAYLRASFRLDESFRDMAKNDPDLERIKDEL